MLIINRYYQGRVYHAEHAGGYLANLDIFQGTLGPIPGCRMETYRRARSLRGDVTISPELIAWSAGRLIAAS